MIVLPHPVWAFQHDGVGIEVYTWVGVECMYIEMILALQGLIDLMTAKEEEGGVGTVAAGWRVFVDGRGMVARGELLHIDPARGAEKGRGIAGVETATV